MTADSPVQLRPLGRLLGDFGHLNDAEKKILDCCRRGEMAVLADGRSEGETASNRVSAAFIRFLALGGDESAPIHEHGVQIQGGWLAGPLDLEGAEISHSLVLAGCTIERIDARRCRLRSLNLSGTCVLHDLNGDGLHCDSDVIMRRGFHVLGEVRLLCARIGGNLDLRSAHLEGGGEKKALTCDGAQIGGSVHLNEGFHATGEVRLVGAQISGGLECQRGKFENPGGDALSLNRATIDGGVFLCDNFTSTGTVSLVATRILGNLKIGSCCLENEGSEGAALTCVGARIGGGFVVEQVKRFVGRVDLSSMHVGRLCDDPTCWISANENLVLDGFTYDRLGGDAPTGSKARIDWLDFQLPAHLTNGFRPQPWEQLISVLRQMGHPQEARDIAVEKQDRLRSANQIVRGVRSLHWLYGVLVGYGYRPLRLLGSLISVWLLCAAAFWLAAHPMRGSRTPLIAAVQGGTDRNTTGTQDFDPLIYSLDVLLPVVDFGHQKDWEPVPIGPPGSFPWGLLLRYLYWFEIAFGWVASLMLVGVLGNLIKKD